MTLIIKLRTIYVLYPEESRTAQVKLIFYTEISQSYWLDCAFHWVSKGWRVPSSSLPLPAAHNRSFNLLPHHQLTVSPSGVFNEEAEQDNRPAPGVGGAGRSLRRGKRGTGGCRAGGGAGAGAFAGRQPGCEGREAAGEPGWNGFVTPGLAGARGSAPSGPRPLRGCSSRGVAGGKPRTQRGKQRGLN